MKDKIDTEGEPTPTGFFKLAERALASAQDLQASRLGEIPGHIEVECRKGKIVERINYNAPYEEIVLRIEKAIVTAAIYERMVEKFDALQLEKSIDTVMQDIEKRRGKLGRGI